MSVINDPVYQAALQTLNRVANLIPMPLNSNTEDGNAFANLSNHLAVARGDTSVGGTLVSDATRSYVLDASGNIQPGVRTALTTWAATLNKLYPLPATAAVITTTGTGSAPVVVTSAPFLGGILDGEIFGIDKKILAAAALLYFFMGGKGK